MVTGSEGRGVKQAPFRVLVGAAMPAVLVEVAFISNPDEEKLLASEAYQAKIAASLARGIERFRRERSARLGRGGAALLAGPAVTPRQANALTVVGPRGPPGHGRPDRAALGGAPAGAGRVRRRSRRPRRGGDGVRPRRRARRRVRAADQRAALLRGAGPGRPAARGARGRLLGRPGAADSAPSSRSSRRARRRGLVPTLPAGTRVLEVFVQARGVAWVDLSSEAAIGPPRGLAGRAADRVLGREHDRDELPGGEPRADRRERPAA